MPLTALPPTPPTPRPRRTARGVITVAALALAIVVPAVGSASAASLGPLSSRALGAGDAPVPRCDADGVTVSYTTAWVSAVANYRVTGATVSGIAAGCNGRTLHLTVRSATGAALYQGSGAVSGTSRSFTGLTIAAPDVAGWAVVFS